MQIFTHVCFAKIIGQFAIGRETFSIRGLLMTHGTVPIEEIPGIQNKKNYHQSLEAVIDLLIKKLFASDEWRYIIMHKYVRRCRSIMSAGGI